MENIPYFKQIDKFLKYLWNFKQERMLMLESGKEVERYLPKVFLAWNNLNTRTHLANKWLSGNESGSMSLLKLWFELDEENKDIFANWINDNYKG